MGTPKKRWFMLAESRVGTPQTGGFLLVFLWNYSKRGTLKEDMPNSDTALVLIWAAHLGDPGPNGQAYRSQASCGLQGRAKSRSLQSLGVNSFFLTKSDICKYASINGTNTCTYTYSYTYMHVSRPKKVLVLRYEGEDLLVLALTSTVPRKSPRKFFSRSFVQGRLASRKLE